MKSLLQHFVRSLIDWLFRRRSPALTVMRIGLACLVLAFGAGWALNVSFPFQGNRVSVVLDSSGGTPTIIVFAAAFVGVVLIFVCLIWEICRYGKDQRRLARKKVIVVEVRGLRQSGGLPLSASIPPGLQGKPDCMLVDLRQGIKDGEIVNPRVALEALTSLPVDLRRREDGLDRADITLLYGGLAPVPFSFLTGVLIDDERPVIILDWNRHEDAWCELNGTDDGIRFQTNGLTRDLNATIETALVVSVSYGINTGDVLALVPGMPIIELTLGRISPDCHWSEEKQRALGQQFLETVIELGTRGIQRIHLFLAAQNSVVFRFGRLYDKRNLPDILVYQYERGATPRYPWCIRMPVTGVEHPQILLSTTPNRLLSI